MHLSSISNSLAEDLPVLIVPALVPRSLAVACGQSPASGQDDLKQRICIFLIPAVGICLALNRVVVGYSCSIKLTGDEYGLPSRIAAARDISCAFAEFLR